MENDAAKIIDHEKDTTVHTVDYFFNKMKENNEKAKIWSTETNIPMMYDTADLKQLEKNYQYYLTGTHDQRIHADDESIAIYGYTNRERYQILKNKLLRIDSASGLATKKPDPAVIGTDISPTETNFINKVQHETSVINDNLADAFMTDCNIHMIKDSDAKDSKTLDDSYNKYMSTNYTNRKKSDLRSMEIYGKNNAERYKELKQQVSKRKAEIGKLEKEGEGIKSDTPIKESIEDYNPSKRIITEESSLDIAAQLFKLSRVCNNDSFRYGPITIDRASFVESCDLKRRFNNILNEKEEISSHRTLDTTPFFTPSELIDLGVFASDRNCYSTNPDNTTLDDGVTTSQWFDNYKYMCDGLVCEDYSSKWIQKMRELYYDFDDIKESGDIDKINARKQSILELGWNPELDFNNDLILKATKRVNNLLEARGGKYSHVDLGLTEEDPVGEYIDQSIEESIAPVFIILDKGNIPILSKSITALTKSEYTHASIGFNPDMSENYSYIAGGFRNETIESYGSDNITVYAFFVKNRVMKKLKKHLQEFIDNVDNTIYDITKYFDYFLDNTKRKSSQFAQVCSTFVDNMLRSAGINITTIGRGIVSPGDVHNAMKKYSGAIYKVYDGNAKKYRPATVKGKITRLMKSKSTNILKEADFTLTENSLVTEFINERYTAYGLDLISKHTDLLTGYNKKIYKEYIEPMVTLSILETKMFPVQFDDDGNLIIYKVKSKNIDYEQEFKDSNKLLQVYEKNNNIEGMKYEVAKLWFLNSCIEKALKTNQNKDFGRKVLVDTRSRILDVFYRYMDIIMKEDPDWNFVVYYNNTPFSDISSRINASTLKYTISALKNIIRAT